MGLILITHNIGVVAETADRVMVQYKGRKMEEADVLVALRPRPSRAYTRALLSALPENATGDRLPTVGDFALEGARADGASCSKAATSPATTRGGALFGASRVVHASRASASRVEKGKTLAIVGESG